MYEERLFQAIFLSEFLDTNEFYSLSVTGGFNFLA